MKERILQFIKSENKSSAQLAEEIGVQPSGISHILSGRNKPSLEFVLKMLEKYKFLSMEWLLFGKGTMYKDPDLQKLFDIPQDINSGRDEKGVREKNTPLQELELAQNKHIMDSNDEVRVEKIVWFYTDRSFKEYFPGRD